MKPHYVLDACAVVALFKDEKGADIVDDVLASVMNGKNTVSMNIVNLLEVYYGFLKDDGKDVAEKHLANIKVSVISITDKITPAVFYEAARLKTLYKMSLADAFVLAETSVSGGIILTCDHHEFDIVAQRENIAFCWLR
ncbi:MAG: PIN domain-containing protein [Planctomycetaceae bacterium]|jgi:PIN domain nuclease of toxin-antitoxin system|nr:PIN domain-containing protein [Planctomycetaceae bacterium]